MLRVIFFLCLNIVTAYSNNKDFDYISSHFLTKPYKKYPLNENKLYTFEYFDCQTYVETVLALVWAHNSSDFISKIKKIRYHDAKVSYVNRHHFPSIDWLPNAYKLKILKDITITLYNENNNPYFKFTNALINKFAWFASQGYTVLNSQVYNKKLAYIPLNKIAQDGKLNNQLLKQLPSKLVVEHVRKNWHPFKSTAMHISHMGLLLHKNNSWIYREASSKRGKVVEESLLALIQRLKNDNIVIGLHIDKVDI